MPDHRLENFGPRPAAAKDVPAAAPKVYDLEAATSEPPKRVLLLDDESDLSSIVKEYLEAHGFLVTAARDGVEGLKLIMAGEFDLILCDLMMPNLPGDMFYLAVERTKPQLCKRFVFMTGQRGDPKWADFVRKIGGLVLWKPFDFQLVLDAFRIALAKK